LFGLIAFCTYNETILAEGSKVAVRGKIAYVAQSAWILNKTVRDNILFGLPYDETKYKAVIKTCQLTHDIALLDDGDHRAKGGEAKDSLSHESVCHVDVQSSFLLNFSGDLNHHLVDSVFIKVAVFFEKPPVLPENVR
jgi:hypothetical protein